MDLQNIFSSTVPNLLSTKADVFIWMSESGTSITIF